MSRIAVILALPIEYNTSSMIRCRAIMRELCMMGNVLVCYCPNPDTEHKYYAEQSLDLKNLKIIRYKKDYIRTNGEDKKVETGRTIKQTLKKNLLNIYRKIDFFGSSIRYVSEKKWVSKDIQSRNCDILISFSDPKPSHIIGGYCKKHNKICYIQQWGDPLASDITNKSIVPQWIKRLIEKILIGNADKICYVSPLTLNLQKQLYPRFSKKMFFLPTPSLDYKEEKIDLDTISFGYFGSYNSSVRNILPFYNAAIRNPDANFYIVGDSDIVIDSTDSIKVIERVSPSEIEEYMKKINVIVCLMNKKGGQIPGKIYHDASSMKDILLIKDGEYGEEIQNYFEKYEHYTFVDNKEDSIDIAIKKYIKNGIPLRTPVEEFKADNIARKLIEV